ncbi:MAG: GTP cyclohydrolase II [Oligoflexales bacterium]
MAKTRRKLQHIVLTSHPNSQSHASHPIEWGAGSPAQRGPVIATTTNPLDRNVIGTHSGSYSIYRALAIASGALKADHQPDLTNTTPVVDFPAQQAWSDPKKIVSIDPYGHMVSQVFEKELSEGVDVRPSIAITKARMKLPEIDSAIAQGRLKPDGKHLLETGDISVIKAAIEPVWYLPGIAERFQCPEGEFRRVLFEETGGMYPELITRPDLKVFLPPTGGITVYLVGDPSTITDPGKPLHARVHDECNGSDVFGSDICTCRPYLVHGIEICVEAAQQGGCGIIAYNRKEGRALGEVTKFLVYNARKRQEGGDRAETYFERTECVAGVQDVRFQELMPDVLLWLGVEKIHRFASMSNMKFDALEKSGIEIEERVTIPDYLIPDDASVEIQAKKAAGYYSEEPVDPESLKETKGRDFDGD